MRRFALLVLALPVIAAAQTHRFPSIDLFAGDPTGYPCNALAIVQSSTTGQIYTCPNGSYVAGASSLSNNQPIQLGNNLGALGTVVLANSSNDLQFGDISNKFTTQSFFLGGNSYQTVNASAVTFTLPLQLAQFSVNGSVAITGAQGNGASVQTASTGSAVGPLCVDSTGAATTIGCTNGSTISVTTSGTSGPATLSAGVLNIPQYTAGGSGVAYSAPTLNFIPLVSSTSGNGTVANSSISDTAGQVAIGDAVTVNNSLTVAAQNVANTGAQNYASNNQTFAISYYNAGTVNDAYTLGTFVNPGTAPTTLFTLYGPSTLSFATASNGVGFILAQNAAYQASIANGNLNSPKFKFRGATRNSSGTNQLDDWNLQSICSTGNQPACAFTFTHSGSSGVASVSVPTLVATGGTPGIQLTAAAFATYPACSGTTEGLEEAVTDSTTAVWGATVTGGGTNHVKMWCNGTNWTVVAK